MTLKQIDKYILQEEKIKMIDTLLKFAREAGELMKAKKYDLHSQKNKSSSVESLVTEADIMVSDLFAKTISESFSALDYMIIDEEKISGYGEDVFSEIDKHEYQFVIDPIDGTTQYASGHPFYGITVGVYKNKKPYMGLVYLPETAEMIYFDGSKAYYDERGQKTELKPHKISASPIIFGHPWLWTLSKNFSVQKALFLDYYSAVSQSLYTLAGKAKGYCMCLNLWDIAGVMPIAEYLGLEIREYKSDKVYNCISPEYFNSNMSTKNKCILCQPEVFEEICELVEPCVKK